MNRHDGPEDQSLGDRCMSGRTPDFNGFCRIVQGENAIAMGYDTGQRQGFQRIINLGGNHPPSQVRLRHGDSRGQWEGDTLVIETTNFSPKFPFRGASANRTLVERYTRVDAETLAYEVTIEDPTVWVAPWTVQQTLKRQSDQENRIYYEPRCFDGNYGISAMFIGARPKNGSSPKARGPILSHWIPRRPVVLRVVRGRRARAQVSRQSLGHRTRVGRSGPRTDQSDCDRTQTSFRTRDPQHERGIGDLGQPWRVSRVAER